ncbi:McrC family protein [Azohydromonas caseinilytica]|uniref:McrC family protein n=1 Tax=Azohydromonas caseinilytica TaxID=2728836 RepID=A0A848FKB8_9BURK|nr:McrC family protein [Azohydromonas caseinilytica]NML18683.1 McrC family protein [Azohydromonas caseinilytica]
MNLLTVFEFDALCREGEGQGGPEVPAEVFNWLKSRCLRASQEGEAAWLRPALRRGREAIQVTSHVGVIRAPGGFQIEVLPKLGKAPGGNAGEARELLIDMLRCLEGFRHIRADSAHLAARRMPLLEVFIAEFLGTVERVVKRGLRSDYVTREDNLPALRGKLLMAQQLRHNLCRADRFFTAHDEFSPDRPENRLLHAALRRVLALSATQSSQKLARELCFVFADIAPSAQPARDFQRVRLDRGMGHYADALAWARLILEEASPLTGAGAHDAPSLLFPMEALFEAFVAKHLARQLAPRRHLKAQARSRHLVQHREQRWFRLQPDLLVREGGTDRIVLDTKWKLLDAGRADAKRKYGLAQADFYQLHAYGHGYLGGRGDVVLIHPLTPGFDRPLPVFQFSESRELRLWVLPFCLRRRQLQLPADAPFAAHLLPQGAGAADPTLSR